MRQVRRHIFVFVQEADAFRRLTTAPGRALRLVLSSAKFVTAFVPKWARRSFPASDPSSNLIAAAAP